MKTNFLTIALAALIPLIIGFIWYGPLLFQKPWMKQLGLKKESLKEKNAILIFTLSYVFSFFIAFFLQFIVICFYFFDFLIMNPIERIRAIL